MQINDLRIQKYNKISHLSNINDPQILSNFCLQNRINYAKQIQSFKANDRNGYQYQIYISRIKPREIINQIVYLKDCPKIIYLNGEPQSLIIQQKIQTRLSEFLIQNQQHNSPYLKQQQARQIVRDVTESLLNYLQHKISTYDCISLKNIVLSNQRKWQLSVVGLLLGVDKDSSQFYTKQISNSQNRMTFALGCLLFKLVFGFCPIVSDPKYFKGFDAKTYLRSLQHQTSSKLIKVYHYVQRVIQLSPQCLNILENSLSGKMTIQDWANHPYFTKSFIHQTKINNQNRQILMINSVEPNNYSLVMSAIDYKKNHAFERLNQQSNCLQDASVAQVLDSLQRHSILSNVSISSELQKKSLMVKSENVSNANGPIRIQYFYNDCFDPQEDFPCRQLIKFIQHHKNQNPQLFTDQNYENKLKLYAYPYALAFQLMKVENQQPIQIKRKIRKLIQMLMQLSSFYYPSKNIQPLHQTQAHFKSFEQIKPIYRQNINELYQYFLNQAMRKYNFKAENMETIEKIKRKEKGLQLYRLCLKLLEGSLIVRKGGADLNLPRIQTCQRKQIQNDLTELLNKYFPKKPEIH